MTGPGAQLITSRYMLCGLFPEARVGEGGLPGLRLAHSRFDGVFKDAPYSFRTCVRGRDTIRENRLGIERPLVLLQIDISLYPAWWVNCKVESGAFVGKPGVAHRDSRFSCLFRRRLLLLTLNELFHLGHAFQYFVQRSKPPYVPDL